MNRSERIEEVLRMLIHAAKGQDCVGYKEAWTRLQAVIVQAESALASPPAPAEGERDYDRSIHHNPSAAAWAAFFMETWRKNGGGAEWITEDGMLGWFANAMCAALDSQPASPPAPAEGEREALEALVRDMENIISTARYMTTWAETRAWFKAHPDGGESLVRARALLAPRPPSSPDPRGMTAEERQAYREVKARLFHAAPSPDPAPCPTCGGPGGYVEVDGLRVPKCCSPAPSPDPSAGGETP